jgi:hypothetical protein
VWVHDTIATEEGNDKESRQESHGYVEQCIPSRAAPLQREDHRQQGREGEYQDGGPRCSRHVDIFAGSYGGSVPERMQRLTGRIYSVVYGAPAFVSSSSEEPATPRRRRALLQKPESDYVAVGGRGEVDGLAQARSPPRPCASKTSESLRAAPIVSSPSTPPSHPHEHSPITPTLPIRLVTWDEICTSW